MDVGALADHVAMVALARGQTEAACKPMRSIANLFNEACPVTFKANTMTDGDLAYLKALYVASPTATANVQRTEIARRMGQMLDDAQ
jgi:hypothetical protein